MSYELLYTVRQGPDYVRIRQEMPPNADLHGVTNAAEQVMESRDAVRIEQPMWVEQAPGLWLTVDAKCSVYRAVDIFCVAVFEVAD